MAGALTYVSQMQADSAESTSRAASAPQHGWVARLLEREGGAVLRMLWRLLGHEPDVLDAYQDCFCKLASLKNPRDVRSARAYLFRTASNVAIEILRGRKRRREHWSRVVDSRGSLTAPPAGAEGEDARIVLLRAAVSELPTHLRNVIMLRDFAQMSYKEVGRTLGIDPATARVYRRHAVVRLADLLEGEQYLP